MPLHPQYSSIIQVSFEDRNDWRKLENAFPILWYRSKWYSVPFVSIIVKTSMSQEKYIRRLGFQPFYLCYEKCSDGPHILFCFLWAFSLSGIRPGTS